jgi:hypothetical protein
MFGMWIKPQPGQARREAVTGMEKALGRKLELDHYYHGWQAPLVGDYGRWSATAGHTLFIGWKAVLETDTGTSNGGGAGYVRWSAIASGVYDDVISARADELKNLGSVVYLNFHHEPEDDRDLPGVLRCGPPAAFIQAWRHIWNVFQERGATNVRFVWVLMGQSFREAKADQWYPGGRYVDVIGSDAYNWFGTQQPGSGRWASFRVAFAAGYAYAVAKHKPFWVAETGTLEDPDHPGRKAQWFTDAAEQIAAWPDLQAFVYFMGGTYGWDVNSSPQAFAAFRTLANEPYFTAAFEGA